MEQKIKELEKIIIKQNEAIEILNKRIDLMEAQHYPVQPKRKKKSIIDPLLAERNRKLSRN